MISQTLHKIPLFLESIKFSHSVFALPFALVAMLVAAGGIPGFWTLFWIVVAVVAARTAAMSFNRLADVYYDARNPRTAGRPLVTGELTERQHQVALILAAMVFVFAAAMLNRTCLYLSPPVLAILLGYSLTKRFTSYSHYVLGLALGLAPLGAWVAVTESLSLVPVLLSLAVILWVAGFDILYACQDVEVDRAEKDLHSLPKRLGVEEAMTLARRSHAASLLVLFLFWWSAGLGFLSLLGMLGVGALLLRQHRLVSPRDLGRINAAFFTSNGLISVGFFVLVFLDLVVFG